VDFASIALELAAKPSYCPPTVLASSFPSPQRIINVFDFAPRGIFLPQHVQIDLLVNRQGIVGWTERSETMRFVNED
jgi:hypothetical protein